VVEPDACTHNARVTGSSLSSPSPSLHGVTGSRVVLFSRQAPYLPYGVPKPEGYTQGSPGAHVLFLPSAPREGSPGAFCSRLRSRWEARRWHPQAAQVGHREHVGGKRTSQITPPPGDPVPATWLRPTFARRSTQALTNPLNPAVKTAGDVFWESKFSNLGHDRLRLSGS
jgi:hypothetical protein